MDYKYSLDQCIWPAHDSYFLKGLAELIIDIDDLIYLSLEKVRREFVFINLSASSLNYFIRRDSEWLAEMKGKQIVLIAARRSEALWRTDRSASIAASTRPPRPCTSAT